MIMIESKKTGAGRVLKLKSKVLLSCVLTLIFIISLVLGENRTISLMHGSANSLHEWIGLTILAGVAIHLGLYWQSVKISLVKYFQMSLKQKIFMSINTLLFAMVVLTVASGIIISPHLGMGKMQSHWRHFHHVAPKITALLMLAHVAFRMGKIQRSLKTTG